MSQQKKTVLLCFLAKNFKKIFFKNRMKKITLIGDFWKKILCEK
jgi:hypothetical protein